MAAPQDLYVDQGTTFSYPFQWTQPARDAEGNVIYGADGLPLPGTPIDITGYSARMQIKKNLGGDVYATLTSANGGIVLGTTDGQVTIFLTDVQTSALPGSGVYDLEMVSPTGWVTRILQGKVRLSREVTTVV